MSCDTRFGPSGLSAILIISPTQDRNVHGTEGLLGVMAQEDHPYQLLNLTMAAVQELGFHAGDIHGSVENEGFNNPHQVTLQDGWRMGSYRSYVEPILGSAPITVLTFAPANRILLRGKKAEGVEVERFGQTFHFKARKEVILSAGAMNSPQLLMLSGIGPREELKKHGIRVVEELGGVGKNLQDHVMTAVSFSYDRQGLSASPFLHLNPLNLFDFFFRSGRGPLAHTGITTVGFVHSPLSPDAAARPDIQFHVLQMDYGVDYGAGLRDLHNVNGTVWDYHFAERLHLYGFSIAPTLIRGAIQ